MNPTTFGQLLDDAQAHLESAHAVRTAAPTTAIEDPNLPALLDDVAAALHTLGRTVGPDGPPTQHLDLALHRPALSFGDRPPTHLTGLPLAATAIRTASDLLATNGPPNPEDVAAVHAHHPRPNHLASRTARAGAWSAIATLTQQLARICQTTATPAAARLADEWKQAAAAVPETALPEGMRTATTAHRLPLDPRTSHELDGRIHELTAIAYRMSQPPPAGSTHPAVTLQQLAGSSLHAYRASAKAHPTNEAHYARRARQWQRIFAALTAIQTPDAQPPRTHLRALTRATQLVCDQPTPTDLTRARAATCQIATWITPALTALAGHPNALADGRRLPALIAASTPNLAAARRDNATVRLRPGDTSRLRTMLANVGQPAEPDTRSTTRATRPTSIARVKHTPSSDTAKGRR